MSESIPEVTVYPRIRRRKSWDENGVAATVGTILSIMVFLTFLGMFTNQYVPIWMKDNENKHMNQVVGQFSSIKSGVDMQILASNAMVASAPIYSPIQLHAEGVPVFASPTMGQLSLTGATTAGGTYATLKYNYTSGNTIYTLDSTGGARVGGSLEFYGPNRYYVQQIVAYENGAIILNQSDGEVVLSGLAIKITPSGLNSSVLITFTSLTGENKTLGGFGTKSVTTSVDYSSYTKVNNSRSAGCSNTLNLTFVSKHGAAWYNYFNETLSKNSVDSSRWKVFKPVALTGTSAGFYRVSIIIRNVISLEFTKAVASIQLAEIGV